MKKVQLNTLPTLENLKDYYYVREDGKVFSTKGREKEKSFSFTSAKTYLRSEFTNKDGTQSQLQLHRIIAFAFVDGYYPGAVVNHLNENKTDNSIENLEWCSQKENINHGTGMERRINTKSQPVEGLDPKTGEVVIRFSSMEEGRRNGYSKISEVIAGNRKTNKQLKWRKA